MSPASNTLSQMLAPGIISTWFEPALRTPGVRLLYVNMLNINSDNVTKKKQTKKLNHVIKKLPG